MITRRQDEEVVVGGDRIWSAHFISLSKDGTVVLHDGTPTKLHIQGGTKNIRIACHIVTFEALERIYALMRRHRDKAHYVAQE